MGIQAELTTNSSMVPGCGVRKGYDGVQIRVHHGGTFTVVHPDGGYGVAPNGGDVLDVFDFSNSEEPVKTRPPFGASRTITLRAEFVERPFTSVPAAVSVPTIIAVVVLVLALGGGLFWYVQKGP